MLSHSQLPIKRRRPLDPQLLVATRGRLDRLPYLVAGLVLLGIKYVLDWTVATQVFDRSWSPLNYLIWPERHALAITQLEGADRHLALALLALSLPFIWMGVMLTWHRLRTAQLPGLLILLFFMPVINLLFFLLLCVLPSRSERPRAIHEDEYDRTQPAWPGPSWAKSSAAVVGTALLVVALMAFGTIALESYGSGLFVGSPFALGMLSVVLFGAARPQPFAACLRIASLTLLCAGGMLLVFGIEGAICILMAIPILVPVWFLGALLGFCIQSRPWLRDQSTAAAALVVLALPVLMAAESVGEPAPALRCVTTTIDVAAPPAAVWPWVIAFPPLAEPDDWLFRAGVAYPLRAEIVGHGRGAVRHCVFSTGAFVEPIDVWDAPRHLRFQVTEQPAPLTELSPWPIHPAHLDHYLVSRQGEFRLIALADGRTRLAGTTWYTNRMWPAPYWNLWSDAIIYRIHNRVLRHIATLAEQPAVALSAK